MSTDVERTADELPDLTGLAPLDGAAVLVTGGTGGIGLHTATGLARLGARVTVTGRDADRGAAAIERIARVSQNPAVDLLPADLSTMQGVRALAQSVLARDRRLHALVNNAGALPSTRVVTGDGLELAVAVNHVAVFGLTHLLLPALRADDGARVVNLTSSAVRFSRTDADRLFSEGGYGASKLASLLTTLESARRLDGTGVVVHAADPGGADTPMTRGMTEAMSPVPRALFRLVGPARRTPLVAARSSLVAVASPALGQTTGRLVNPRGKVVEPPRRAADHQAAQALWAATAARLGI